MQAQVAQFTHTCFMVTPYEGYVEVVRGAQPPHPRRPREALGAVQLRRRGRGERREDRPRLHQARRRRRLRARLPRPHQPHDGDDGEEHAVQAVVRTVRLRGLPRAAVVPATTTAATAREAAGRRDQPHRQGDRRRQRRRDRHRADRGRGRLHRPGRRASCPRSSSTPTPTASCSSPTRSRPASAAPATWFACEHEGIVPDLITTAKGIAGGLPLAGVTGRAEIMDAVHVGGLGGTYGGNPVACAAALGSIATMEELDLNAAARRDRGRS